MFLCWKCLLTNTNLDTCVSVCLLLYESKLTELSSYVSLPVELNQLLPRYHWPVHVSRFTIFPLSLFLSFSQSQVLCYLRGPAKTGHTVGRFFLVPVWERRTEKKRVAWAQGTQMERERERWLFFGRAGEGREKSHTLGPARKSRVTHSWIFERATKMSQLKSEGEREKSGHRSKFVAQKCLK